MSYADPLSDVAVQRRQGGSVLAVGAGGTVGFDAGSTLDTSGVNAASSAVSGANNITAFASGGQASATQLTAVVNRVVTVATAADSVKLPATTNVAAGQCIEITVTNAAANSLNVFPATGDAINALGANAAFAVAAGKTATFFCVNAGVWHSLLSA
jgi:hypothetical protein